MRSYSMKPVTFPMIVVPCSRRALQAAAGVRRASSPTCALLPRAGRLHLALVHLGQRALVLVREHLDELACAPPPSCPAARARACCRSSGCGLRAASSAAPRRSGRRASRVLPPRRSARPRCTTLLQRHHRGVAAAGELAVLVVHVGDAAATCRPRSCGRSCPAPARCRRSCIRSRGRPCLRPPPWRPTGAPRSARRPRR